jgi:hypothetical protein
LMKGGLSPALLFGSLLWICFKRSEKRANYLQTDFRRAASVLSGLTALMASLLFTGRTLLGWR